MPARKGTRGYYTAKIDNDTITADELEEYAKLLDNEIEQNKARQKELREAKKIQVRTTQYLKDKEANQRKLELGEALLDKFGDDLDITNLVRSATLGGSVIEKFGDDVDAETLILESDAPGPSERQVREMEIGGYLMSKFGDDVDAENLVLSSDANEQYTETVNSAKHLLELMWNITANSNENLYQFCRRHFGEEAVDGLSRLVGFEVPENNES